MESRHLILGAEGLVGSELLSALNRDWGVVAYGVTRRDGDLRVRDDVRHLIQLHRPEMVWLAAAKVGGIGANVAGGSAFFYDNVEIQKAVIAECAESDVESLAILGSTCIYPVDAPKPVSEESFMRGPLEPTNEGYALAKIAGIYHGMLEHRAGRLRVFFPMPCNLAGSNDHYERDRAHVLAALVKVFVDATAEGDRSVTLWGSGEPRREFLHVTDLVRALRVMVERDLSGQLVNVGSGCEISIKHLAEKIAAEVGYPGEVEWDTTRPSGVMSKLVDSNKLRSAGWRPTFSIDEIVKDVILGYGHILKGSQ